MPLVADALDSLAGASVFSTLDLKRGFRQIQMHQNSQKKTVFATHNVLNEFLTMPIGLANSGASFQRLIFIYIFLLKTESLDNAILAF